MTHARGFRPFLILFTLAVLILAGCAKSNSSTPPTPAPVTVTNAIKTLADVDVATVQSVIAARNSGACSAADAKTIENALKAVANAGLQMDAELRSADQWNVQQAKLVLILQSAGLDALKANVSPEAYALVTAVITAANQLSVSLGGPQI